MTLKAVIFDMDGVLVDSIRYHMYAWKKSFENEGVNLKEEDFAIYEGSSCEDTFVFLEKNQGVKLTEVQKNKVMNFKNNLFDEIYQRKVYSGIISFILDLKKKNIKLAVVTGSSRVLAERIIKQEFDNMFNFVVTSNDTSNSKPHPEPYLKAVKLLGLNKEECVVIENAPLGITSAKEAGLKVYALETTLHKKHLIQADKVFKNHEDLIKYLNENDLS
ncbi:MAG: HAD family hydrolase [Candidatus Nanoarchaeia archaeon]